MNPVIDKIYVEHLFTVNCIEKTKIKQKRPEMAILKILIFCSAVNYDKILTSTSEVNLKKQLTIVIYNSRVVLATNLPITTL